MPLTTTVLPCCIVQQIPLTGAAASEAAACVQGQEKMSKSDPNSAIFMEDSKEDVDRKIKKAFCPPNVVQGNPCLKYIQLIILPWSGSFTVNFSKEGGREKCVPFPYMICSFVLSFLTTSELHASLTDPQLSSRQSHGHRLCTCIIAKHDA